MNSFIWKKKFKNQPFKISVLFNMEFPTKQKVRNAYIYIHIWIHDYKLNIFYLYFYISWTKAALFM